MDPLFPEMPGDIKALSDDDLAALLAESEEAAKLIKADDSDFLKGLTADEVITQFRTGAEQILSLRAEQTARVEAHETYKAELDSIGDVLEVKAEAEVEAEEETDEQPVAEAEQVEEVEEEKAVVEERELVLASAEPETPEVEEVSAPRLRRAPAPAPERVVVQEEKRLAFVASGLLPTTAPGTKLEDKAMLASAVQEMARALGSPVHEKGGREVKHRVARLDFSDNFPEERTLGKDWITNAEKIAAIGSPLLPGGPEALTASGGFCAPFTPIYSMPQLAVQSRPVRDALPSYRAERGGINVPTPTTMGDAAGAITVITAEEDALGGTFATKACLDMECPDYTETAVTIISHCREYGNLNAMAWPEKISHENELTMAEHARVAEGYLLGRLDALSLALTGAATYGASRTLVYVLRASRDGIISRMRMNPGTRFRVILPFWAASVFSIDLLNGANEYYSTAPDAVAGVLSRYGFDVVWHIDEDFPDGTEAAIFADEVASSAVDVWPSTLVARVYPEGTFLHLDMAELNLGIVRDSTLNSTNDFQVFGETFENVARIGPAQAAHSITIDICPDGTVAPAATSAITCS